MNAKEVFAARKHEQKDSQVSAAPNTNYRNLILASVSSPHATQYENLDATRKYRWTIGIIFVFILLGYLFLCE
jgi:hypothetical protein